LTIFRPIRPLPHHPLRSSPTPLRTARHFSSFDLQPSVARGIQDAGFVRCTPIQAQTLPFALTGRDIAGQAQTGTGKTAAFLVSMFQTLLTHKPRGELPKTAIAAS
jgi:ATP-dependent RNA helicase RhlB